MARSADGTDFKTDDLSLQRVLDRVRRERTRVRVTYDGDFGEMGKDHDFGYIGRSLGNPSSPNGGVKAPLLIHNTRSHGGGILMDDHIIKVEVSKGRSLLWKRPEPKAPETWTFRAECEADLDRLRENLDLKVVTCTRPNATEGDVHVTVVASSPEDLVEAMLRTADLHIAIGTLKATADFDGVQDGPFLSRAYGLRREEETRCPECQSTNVRLEGPPNEEGYLLTVSEGGELTCHACSHRFTVA